MNFAKQKYTTSHTIFQCSIPVFEGLLPEPHNKQLMTVLFRLAEWHALAKLRVHTETTLAALEKVTTIVGRELRKFHNVTCASFHTVELPNEAAARQRRVMDLTSTSVSTANSSHSVTRKPKTLNLNTYKFHAMGDYVDTIHTFGTTDLYTTQIVRHLTDVQYRFPIIFLLSRASWLIGWLSNYMGAPIRNKQLNRSQSTSSVGLT